MPDSLFPGRSPCFFVVQLEIGAAGIGLRRSLQSAPPPAAAVTKRLTYDDNGREISQITQFRSQNQAQVVLFQVSTAVSTSITYKPYFSENVRLSGVAGLCRPRLPNSVGIAVGNSPAGLAVRVRKNRSRSHGRGPAQDSKAKALSPRLLTPPPRMLASARNSTLTSSAP